MVIASVIQKIKENKEKARFHEQINMSSDDGGSETEDESKHFWISPLIEEENKENSPKFTKIREPKIIAMPKLSKLELSPKYHMNSIVSQELDRFETERQLEVEAKVFERRKRFSMDHEDISRKSTQNMEHSIKKIQLNMAHQLGWFD